MISFRSLSLTLVIALVPHLADAQIGRIVNKAKDALQQKKDSSADSTKAVAPAAGAATAAPGTGVWLNYDFIPGERVIWADDFATDDVGDFPRRLRLVSGNFEVVDVKGKKYLRTSTGGTVRIELPEALPDRFTVEARYWGPQSGNPLRFTTDRETSSFGCYQMSGFVHATDGTNSDTEVSGIPEHDFVDCRFTIDTRYIKAYLNTTRVANHPGATVTRAKELFIDMPSMDVGGSLLTDIRIAAGGKKLYDLLSTNGRVATQGILFDTGSDRIRGESTPTLKEIGDMLAQHADLKLTIEGHTDNVGSDASNLTLSEKRAAAVKAYLVTTFQVDAARLQSKGFGASKPATTNATPEGRQNNRRVELVKNP